MEVEVGALITAPTPPTKEGFLFDGWFLDSALITPFTFDLAPSSNITLYAKWVEDIYFGAMSIASFKATPISTYAEVVGVVLFAHIDMSLVIIADETSTLAVISNTTLVLGDVVRMGGIHHEFNGHPVMVNALEDPSLLWLVTYASDQSVPLTPTVYSLDEWFLLDPMLPNNWIQYVTLAGTLIEIDHQFMLQVGDNTVPILITSMDDYENAMMYVGFEVLIDGVCVPNFDDAPMLMFIYIGGENHLRYNYTDEALLSTMLMYLKAYLESVTYYPGQTIDLPDSHPLLPMLVSYEAVGLNAGMINLETMLIDETIDEPLIIDLIATGYYLTYTHTIDIHLTIEPIVLTSIATFLTYPDDYETFYFVEGVIVFTQLEHQFVMIADATGAVFVLTNDSSLMVGDHILVRGVKMSSPEMSMVMLANEPSQTVVKIIAHEAAMPLTATPIALADFIELDASASINQWRYFEITGTLHYDEIHEVIYVSDGITNVMIFPRDETAAIALMAKINDHVVLRGLSIRPGEETFLILVFLNFGNDLI